MATSFGKRGLASSAATSATASTPQQTLPHPYRKATIACGGVILVILFTAARLGQGATVPATSNEKTGGPVSQSASAPPFRKETAAVPTYPVVTPITLCKDRYTLDYQMRETCIRSQEEAKLEVASIQIDDDVKRLCAKRYIHDWSMYATCAKSQMAAKLPATEKPDRPSFDIRRKCEEKWPDDYRMQDYCIRQQAEAQSRASGNWIDHRIAIHCTGKWPHDWNMFMYCVDGQTKANSRLH
jgi:hypothetical protein